MHWTDKELLDGLDEANGTYSGRLVCRWSSTNRGIRLHETHATDAFETFPTVREAIEAFLDAEAKKAAERVPAAEPEPNVEQVGLPRALQCLQELLAEKQTNIFPLNEITSLLENTNGVLVHGRSVHFAVNQLEQFGYITIQVDMVYLHRSELS